MPPGEPVELSTASFGSSGTGLLGRPVACTLLGPEGSALAARRGLVPRTSVRAAEAGRLECRPYVENYTVDASIFESREESSFGAGSSVDS